MDKHTNNILVIDETSESNVSYKKSGIASSFEYKPDFDELLNIFNDEREMIYELDTSKCLLIIDKSGNELSMYEYFKKRHDGTDINSLINNIDFLKITNDILAEHNAEIYIKNMLYDKSVIKDGLYDRPVIKTDHPWCGKCNNHSQNTYNLPDYKNMTDTERNKTAYQFIDGYILCREMLDNYNEKRKNDIDNRNPVMHIEKFYEPCVLTFCNDFEFKNNGYVYKGYLPSLYQMQCLIKYMRIIDYIGNCLIPLIMWIDHCNFWTSCEYDNSKSFSIGFQKPNDIYVMPKISTCKVFPIFKKISEKEFDECKFERQLESFDFF